MSCWIQEPSQTCEYVTNSISMSRVTHEWVTNSTAVLLCGPIDMSCWIHQVTHVSTSRTPYQWVMSHTNESRTQQLYYCVALLTCPVEFIKSHMWVRHELHINESYHTRMSHELHSCTTVWPYWHVLLNSSSHTCGYVTDSIWMSHVTHEQITNFTASQLCGHMDKSCGFHQWESCHTRISHELDIWMHHVHTCDTTYVYVHMNESCHKRMSHELDVWMHHVHTCDTTYVYVHMHESCHTRMSHELDIWMHHVRHDLCIRATWLTQIMWRDPYICVTWRIYMCDMSHSYERYVSSACVCERDRARYVSSACATWLTNLAVSKNVCCRQSAVCCSVCCSVLHLDGLERCMLHGNVIDTHTMCCSVMQRVAACVAVCVAVCCTLTASRDVCCMEMWLILIQCVAAW